MKSIRIGAGAGYAGDRIEPALDIIERGNVDYMIFECLAERTIALAQAEKLQNPQRGYNSMLEYRMERVIPLLREHPVKIITNMGAANPLAAAEKVREIAAKNGLESLKVAAIEGDDILEEIGAYYDYTILETGEKLSTLDGKIVSANAYIGSRAITAALAGGADIIITGRVADPSLFTGAIMHHFGVGYDDYNFLGKGIAAGHLLECAGQVTGGYFADGVRKNVPELWNIGFPILTFSENGDMVIEKLPNTGGVINAMTVKEQLLYEIQNPSEYYTPDVIADFSQMRVEELGENRVKVTNAAGREKSGNLKVSIGYNDGYIGEGEISYGGHGCVRRAKMAEEIILKRLAPLGDKLREIRTDIIGVSSLYGNAAELMPQTEPVEVRLRIAGRANDAETARMVEREVEALYVNGPYGGGGATGGVRKVVAIASIFIPEDGVNVRSVDGGKK